MVGKSIGALEVEDPLLQGDRVLYVSISLNKKVVVLTDMGDLVALHYKGGKSNVEYVPIDRATPDAVFNRIDVSPDGKLVYLINGMKVFRVYDLETQTDSGSFKQLDTKSTTFLVPPIYENAPYKYKDGVLSFGSVNKTVGADFPMVLLSTSTGILFLARNAFLAVLSS